MPRGNLTLINLVTKSVVQSGLPSAKAAQKAAVMDMKQIAQTSDSEEIAQSYQVYTPYKNVGENGKIDFRIPRSDLIEIAPETESVEESTNDEES